MKRLHKTLNIVATQNATSMWRIENLSAQITNPLDKGIACSSPGWATGMVGTLEWRQMSVNVSQTTGATPAKNMANAAGALRNALTACNTLEGTKRFRGAVWISARNGQRTSSTPNNRTFCIHAVLRNIVSNIRNVSVTPIWPCVNSKLEVYCEKSLHGYWTCKTGFRYSVVNNGPSNIRKCVEPTGTHAASTERTTKHWRTSCMECIWRSIIELWRSINRS